MPPSQTMRAIKTVSSGPLTIETLPVPTPGPEQVLIKIAAAGVNRIIIECTTAFGDSVNIGGWQLNGLLTDP